MGLISIETRTMPSNRPTWIRAAFLGSVAISIAVVVRRLIGLVHPSSNGPPSWSRSTLFFRRTRS